MQNPLFETLFARHAGREDTFLHLEDGSTLTYADLLQGAARLANLFTAMGIGPGDRIALQVAKSPEALMVYAACAQAGIVFLPLNTAYTAKEMEYFVGNSGAKLLICDPRAAGELTPIAMRSGAEVETLDAGGSGSLMTKAADHPESFETAARGEDDLAAFLYTSGTTGRSKGAMLTQENLLSNARALVEAWRFTEDDVLLHALPIFHAHGLFVACNVMLLAGGSMIFLPKFDADAVIDRLPQATAMMGVPTFYTRLLADDRFTKDRAQHMRLFVSGSAPLAAETHRRFEERTGHRILERYGMTETSMITSNPYDGERRAGTVGFPLPGVEVKVTDPGTGEALADGETGMIEVRGPNVFKGYWQMPEKTAEELRPDGFFITGDLGMRDADGYVTIVGRDKDLIISGGYNVYPREIEAVLDALPGIAESAVIGIPHEDFGETPLAVLIPEPGATPDLDIVRAAIRDELARYKHPSAYEILDALPRNTMGKVQKAALRERFG